MSLSKFLFQLLVTVLISFASYYALKLFVPDLDYLTITTIGVGLFVLIALGIFLLSNGNSAKTDKNFFIYIIVINIFIKIIASFLVIGVFVKMTSPPDKLYLLPFTLIYLIFTIFETYFLSIQARAK